MPDYRAPNGWTERSDESGLYLALMDRLRKADTLSTQEKEDTLRDAATIGSNPDRLDTSMYNSILHPLRALGLAKSPLPALPDRPATFRNEPLVVGQPDKARMVHALTSAIPDLKSPGSEKIVFGPTEGSERTLLASNFPQTGYDISTLLGVHDSATGHISVNPGYQQTNDFYGQAYGPKKKAEHLPVTVMHEMLHGRGFDDRDTYKLADMIPKDLKTVLEQMAQVPKRFR